MRMKIDVAKEDSHKKIPDPLTFLVFLRTLVYFTSTYIYLLLQYQKGQILYALFIDFKIKIDLNLRLFLMCECLHE